MANTIKINSKKTKMVAHQGLFGLEKGNTNLAFVAAGNREKYFGIETDVHRTADGKYVCIHDSNTKSVSGVDMDVEGSTFDSLRLIPLHGIHGETGRVDIRIPSLEEYIGICNYYGKTAVLELKTPFTDEQVKEIIDIIDSLGHLENTIFISFHRCDMEAVRKYLPEQKAQYLTSTWSNDVKEFITANKLDLDIAWPAVTREVFEDIRDTDCEINIWTVDDPDMAETFADWGADYITTNILE